MHINCLFLCLKLFLGTLIFFFQSRRHTVTHLHSVYVMKNKFQKYVVLRLKKKRMISFDSWDTSLISIKNILIIRLPNKLIGLFFYVRWYEFRKYIKYAKNDDNHIKSKEQTSLSLTTNRTSIHHYLYRFVSIIFTIIAIAAVACLIAACLWIINSRYDYFKRRNISGPTPRFFYGHYKEFWSTDTYSKQLQEWTRQYGPIYGLLEGTRHMYVVSDVDFLQEVYIKKCSSFHSRLIPKILQGNNINEEFIYSEQQEQNGVVNDMLSILHFRPLNLNLCHLW